MDNETNIEDIEIEEITPRTVRVNYKDYYDVNAGAIILPPSPGFYFRPEAINDLVDFIVARILDQLHIGHNIIGEWGSD